MKELEKNSITYNNNANEQFVSSDDLIVNLNG